jgi:hypothetical protein
VNLISEIFDSLWHPMRDGVGCAIAWLCAGCCTAVFALTVAIAHDLWFEHTHSCVESGRYWEEGHIVGVIGKGGYYQSAGWRWICYEWSPNDGRLWLP